MFSLHLTYNTHHEIPRAVREHARTSDAAPGTNFSSPSSVSEIAHLLFSLTPTPALALGSTTAPTEANPASPPLSSHDISADPLHQKNSSSASTV